MIRYKASHPPPPPEQINKEALRAQTNSTGYTTFERLIPKEAMFIIFNFAMSNSFTAVDIDRLQFPAQYKVGAGRGQGRAV
jgi:beta-glucanase (GH16 family)